MKYASRLTLNFLRWVHLAFLFLGMPIGHSQFRQEMATLEAMYEERARGVLETVLNPSDYSVVIAVQIEQDAEQLAKIEEEYESLFLPGMPGAGSLENMGLTNQLHGLKNRVDLHLILSTTVPDQKVETIKSLLKSKLHLDEQSGDSISVARVSLPSTPEDRQPAQLPELSWKMWALVMILALLALGGLLLYLSKRQQRKLAAQAEDTNDTPALPLEPVVNDSADGKSILSERSQLPSPSELLYEQKSQMILYATEFPEATARALTEYFQKGNELNVLLMCEAMGWDLSKKVFSFAPRIWNRMSRLIIERENRPSTEDHQKATAECHRVVLARYLDLGGHDLKDPFAFVWKLAPAERRRLLEAESPYSIALICLNSNPEQIAELIGALPDQTQEAITLQIARLEKVPEESIRLAVDVLLKKLRVIQERPEIEAEGPALAAELLRSLPPHKEISYFEKLRLENPKEADQIRRRLLMYPDLVHVPSDVINELGSLVDVSTFVRALKIGYPEVKEYVLQSLPPKRAAMVRRDLDFDPSATSTVIVAEAQRELVTQVSRLLTARGFGLEQLLPSSFEVGVGHEEKAG